MEPCFQSENEPQKWFARTRRGGFRETIIGDQNQTPDVMRANPPRRVLQIRFWQSLWLAVWPRGGGPPGAQRARVPRRAAAIPPTAAALPGSPRDGKAKCSRHARARSPINVRVQRHMHRCMHMMSCCWSRAKVYNCAELLVTVAL